MADEIHYPIDDLQTTATTQGKNLDDSWQAHLLHINQHIFQPALQLGGKGGDAFHQHMTTWHQNLEKYYQALAAYTGGLKASGTKMSDQDTDIAQQFKGFE